MRFHSKKRQRCLLFTATLLIFVGLGMLGTVKSYGAEKLEVWLLNTYVPEFNEKWKAIIADWAKTAKVGAKVETVTYEDWEVKIGTAVETKVGPDLAILPTSGPHPYYAGLLDVSDFAPQLAKQHGGYYAVSEEMSKVNGRWYAVPFTGENCPMLYRKDWLDAIGEKPAATYPDLLRLAQKLDKYLKEKKINAYAWAQSLGKVDDAKIFNYNMLFGLGGSIVAKDGKTVTLNSKPTHDMLKILKTAYDEGLIPNGAPGWGGGDNNRLWLGGQAAISQNGPSIVLEARKTKPEIAKVTIHAQIPGNVGFFYPMSWGIFKWTKQPKLAKDLLAYQFKQKNLQELFTAGGGAFVPAMKGFEEAPLWKDPVLKPIVEQMKVARWQGYPGPQTVGITVVYARNVLEDMVARVIVDKWAIEKAVEEATKKVSDILAEFNK